MIEIQKDKGNPNACTIGDLEIGDRCKCKIEELTREKKAGDDKNSVWMVSDTGCMCDRFIASDTPCKRIKETDKK